MHSWKSRRLTNDVSRNYILEVEAEAGAGAEVVNAFNGVVVVAEIVVVRIVDRMIQQSNSTHLTVWIYTTSPGISALRIGKLLGMMAVLM